MKLIRHGDWGNERPGLLMPDGTRKDTSSLCEDYGRAFFNRGGLETLQDISQADLLKLPTIPQGVRWAAPITRPGKVICVGLNYRDHAEESGMSVPDEPILFFKAANTVVGPNDDIVIPRRSKKTDWEVELAVVIGEDCKYLDDLKKAESVIAGYCVANDVSERHFQLERGGQWVKGKSCDTFNPLGPFLATRDEVADPSNLDMQLSVNGKVMQQGNTRTMIFDVLFIVHYTSQFMTLEAGDVISTGTPPGVGLGMSPPRFLKKNDIVELSIQSLGAQRQVCAQA